MNYPLRSFLSFHSAQSLFVTVVITARERLPKQIQKS
nr:MAG TPA: hypothetical protein [Caudoviricetes sp.]